MSQNFTTDELNVLMLALNDREGVLSGDWERAHRSNQFGARAEELRAEMNDLRKLSEKVSAAFDKASAAERAANFERRMSLPIY